MPREDKIHKTICKHKIEAHESQRCRIQESGTRRLEDHIAERRDNSMTHFELAHKHFLIPQEMKIPDAKAAVDKEWDKLMNYLK